MYDAFTFCTFFAGAARGAHFSFLVLQHATRHDAPPWLAPKFASGSVPTTAFWLAVLKRVREERLRQLRASAQRHREAAAVQYGTLHQLPPADALVGSVNPP